MLNIVCLTKRRPQGRDLIDRPYGRFVNLPKQLSTYADVSVTVFVFDYESGIDSQHYDGIMWISIGLRKNPSQCWSSLNCELSRINPDWILGFSDTWYGILAARLASAHDCRYLIDAYDNYEAYIPWAKPLHWLWRRAIKNADAITAAGPQLLDRLCVSRGYVNTAVIPMAADELFMPSDSAQARRKLGLNRQRKFLGYCGTADNTRGIDVFVQAVELVLSRRADVDLVLTGRNALVLNIPADRVHCLGYIDDDLMPAVLNSCDVLVAVGKNSAFGCYSYPVKIYEAIACGRPILASDTDAARWILNGDERQLVKLGDYHELARKIEYFLDHPTALSKINCAWECSGEQLYALLVK